MLRRTKKKRKMKRLGLIAVALFTVVAFTSSVNAQKIGYTNSAAILQAMPEFKSAETTVATYKSQLQSKLEKAAADWQAKVQKFQQDYQSGILTPVQAQEKEAALGTEQQEIAQMEQQLSIQLNQKETEVLEPILIKLQDAIEAVGKENGYDYILNADNFSGGVILYKKPGDDVTAKVKAKLGM